MPRGQCVCVCGGGGMVCCGAGQWHGATHSMLPRAVLLRQRMPPSSARLQAGLTVSTATSSAIFVSALYALPCSISASTSYSDACARGRRRTRDNGPFWNAQRALWRPGATAAPGSYQEPCT
jgi:hypothetical protein